MQKIKEYLLNVALNKYLPIGGMAALTWLGTFMAAHTGMLEPWGVNYIQSWSMSWFTTHAISGPVLLIELDTTSTTAIAAIIALAGIAMRATEHHVNAPSQGEPSEKTTPQ